MNNKQFKEKMFEIYKNLNNEDYAVFVVQSFGHGGGTELLGQNSATTAGASDAAVLRAMEDFQQGKISIENLPTYTAMVGVAAGVTLGVYLMAKTFGLEDQLLDGAEDMEEVKARLDKAMAKNRAKFDEKRKTELGDVKPPNGYIN